MQLYFGPRGGNLRYWIPEQITAVTWICSGLLQDVYPQKVDECSKSHIIQTLFRIAKLPFPEPPDKTEQYKRVHTVIYWLIAHVSLLYDYEYVMQNLDTIDELLIQALCYSFFFKGYGQPPPEMVTFCTEANANSH